MLFGGLEAYLETNSEHLKFKTWSGNSFRKILQKRKQKNESLLPPCKVLKITSLSLQMAYIIFTMAKKLKTD